MTIGLSQRESRKPERLCRPKTVFHNSLTPSRGVWLRNFPRTRVAAKRAAKRAAQACDRPPSRSHAAPRPISTGFAFQQLQRGTRACSNTAQTAREAHAAPRTENTDPLTVATSAPRSRPPIWFCRALAIRRDCLLIRGTLRRAFGERPSSWRIRGEVTAKSASQTLVAPKTMIGRAHWNRG
ncbi:unnamed protein product, partial [Iphiclides podalirius]